jgi:hypothetical protein
MGHEEVTVGDDSSADDTKMEAKRAQMLVRALARADGEIAPSVPWDVRTDLTEDGTRD